MMKWISDRLPQAVPVRSARARRRPLRLESLQSRVVMATDLAAIVGTAFLDANGNGTVEAGETRLQNVDVDLFLDVDNNGAFSTGDTPIGSLTTGPDGTYRFTNLDGNDATGVTSTGNYVLQFSPGTGGVQNPSGTVINGVVLPGDTAVTVTEDDGDVVSPIDNFQNAQPNQPITATVVGATVTSSSGALTSGGGVIGDERDVSIRIDSATSGTSEFAVNTGTGQLVFSNGGDVRAQLLVQYDGLDADGSGLTLNANGLGGVDLSGNDPSAGVELAVRSDQAINDALVIRVYSSATSFSTTTLDLPANIGAAAAMQIFVPFSAFVQGAGATTPANFTSVGAVEAFVDGINSTPVGGGSGAPSLDLFVSVLDAVNSDVVIANAPATAQVALGGEIFVDNGGGVVLTNQNDGINQMTGTGAEPRFLAPAGNPITVQLFNTDPAVGTPTAIATTTVDTVAGTDPGSYLFDGLAPGTYWVVIPGNQFSVGDALFGFDVSAVAVPGGNGTNANADDDNDGVRETPGDLLSDVIAGPITLMIGDEPAGPENDTNVNTTVDFGVLPVTDLRIDKTLAAASNPTPGGTAVFTVTVANLGNSNATEVVVEDVLPAGLTFVSVVDDNGATVAAPQITENGETFNRFTIAGGLAAGATEVYTVTASIAATATGTPNNLIRVSAFEVEVDLDLNDADNVAPAPLQGAMANNVAIEPVNLTNAVLDVTKDDGVTNTTPGSQLTYTITVTNTVATTALGVTAIDTLPAGTTFVSAAEGTGNQNPGDFTFTDNADGTVSFTFGDLAQNQTGVATLTVLVDQNIAAGAETLTNSVTADATNADPDTATDITTVDLASDVQITKTLLSSRTPNTPNDTNPADDIIDTTAPIAVTAGGFATYQVTVANLGPAIAAGVTLTDTLPAALTLVPGSFNAGTSGATISANGQVLTFDLGDVPATGATPLTFTYEVQVARGATGPIVNPITVTTPVGDPPAGNDDDETITPVAAIDLTIVKTAAPATLTAGTTGAGNQTTFTLVVRHDTDSLTDATGVVVVDTLPPGLTFVSATSGGAAVTPTLSTVNTPANTVVTFPAFDLAVGQERTITVVATAAASATGALTNVATVTPTLPAGVTELDTTNNSDDAVVTVNPAFDVTLTKRVVGSDQLRPGDSVQFEIIVSHDTNDDGTEADNGQSPSVATGIVLTDALPAGLTFVSASDSPTSTMTNAATGVTTVTFAPFSLAPTATRTFTITATVGAAATGNLINNASITADAGETQTNNNAASDDLDVTPRTVDITVNKSVNQATADPGDTLTYTVVVTNNGPDAAAGVVATDTLPPGVTFVSGTGPAGAALTASATGVVTVNVGSLANAATSTFTILATVNAGATGTLTNNVAVTTTTTETNTANNSATAATTVDQALNELSGRIFSDPNNNGIQDAGEQGLAGIALQLTGGGLTSPLSTTTNAAGDYVFANLADGTYTVRRMTLPPNFTDGLEQAGPTAPPAQLGDQIGNVTLGPNDRLEPGLNFALTPDPLMSKRRFLSSVIRG